jgi:hypothetical protein
LFACCEAVRLPSEKSFIWQNDARKHRCGDFYDLGGDAIGLVQGQGKDRQVNGTACKSGGCS